MLEQGSANRVTAATRANPVSSRSHALLLATIHKYDAEEHLSKYSQLYMVDLAGSEKVSKTGLIWVRMQRQYSAVAAPFLILTLTRRC